MNKFKGAFILLLLSFMTIENATGQKLQLSMPEVNIFQTFLQKLPAKIEYDFRMDGSTIRYSIDGVNPTSSSKRYVGPLLIKVPCVVKASAFHPDFEASDVVTTHIYPKPLTVKTIEISKPSDKYSGDGKSGMIDGLFGTSDFKNGYLGYNDGQVDISLLLNKKQKIKQVSVSLLVQHGSWIFCPSKVALYNSSGKLISEYISEKPMMSDKGQKKVITIPLTNYFSDVIKVKIYPLESIPNWHDGSGSKGWLFIDEVWVN